MTRWKLTLEYDGTGFLGWQRQALSPTVQEVLENAVEAFTGERVVSHTAGRTDSGVHALGQVAHVDIERPSDPHTVQMALNQHLKAHPVAVLAAEAVTEDFHARFSAKARHYRFRISNRRAQPVLERGRVWWVPAPLDAEAMHAAAQELVGHHDFTTFRAVSCQAASPVKTLERLDVTRLGEEIEVIAEARSFLHHQVRNMVGTLSLVGRGRWRPRDVAQALAARDRAAGGPTSPPEGLYLERVLY